MHDEGDGIDRAAARRNGRLVLLMIGGLALVSGLTGAVVGALRNDGHATGHSHHGVGLVLVLALTVGIPLAAGGGVLVWLLRRPSYQRVMQYGWFERRRTFTTIKAGRPLDQRQVRIARAALDYTQRQRWFLWLWPALIALWLLNGLTHRDDVLGKVQIGMAVAYLLGLPFALWQRRRVLDRTRRALDDAQPS